MNIQPGDLLGVLAPSSPCDPDIFKAGLTWLEQAGFRTLTALDPTAAWQVPRHLFSSDSPGARVQGMYDLFENPEVKAILSVRGGYGAMELLPLLDFNRLSGYSKPFVGISDGTVLMNALGQRTPIPVIHGATFGTGFSKAATNPAAEESCRDLFALLGGRGACNWEEKVSSVVGDADFEGAIVGGNLSMLAAVAGTPWAPNYNGRVLFIEEIGEKPYRLHRLLMQLKLAGSLDQLKGVVVGELLNCMPPEGSAMTLEDILRDIFSDFDYPVVVGAPFGHGALNRAFRIGGGVSVSRGVVRFM